MNRLQTCFCFPLPEQPLFFSEELQNQEAEEGNTVTLHCELSKPGVSVQWKKGTVLLKNCKKYEIKQDGCELQLQMTELTAQDSGAYRCCVGSLVTTCSVTVNGIQICLNNKVLFSCRAL